MNKSDEFYAKLMSDYQIERFLNDIPAIFKDDRTSLRFHVTIDRDSMIMKEDERNELKLNIGEHIIVVALLRPKFLEEIVRVYVGITPSGMTTFFEDELEFVA